MSVLTKGKRVIQKRKHLSNGVFSYMVKCTSMRKDLQWFYDHIGQTVTRNGRYFTIGNKQVAEYAWDLQENHEFIYE